MKVQRNGEEASLCSLSGLCAYNPGLCAVQRAEGLLLSSALLLVVAYLHLLSWEEAAVVSPHPS